MTKISLNIDFIQVVKRINSEMKGLKPSEWAEKIGVSRNIVSNIHGATQQKPSLEYIVAVSMATGKPVEYYLYGKNINNIKDIEANEKEKKRKFDVIDELEEWLSEEVKKDTGNEIWFKIQIEKSIPGFKDWKQRKESRLDSGEHSLQSKVA